LGDGDDVAPAQRRSAAVLYAAVLQALPASARLWFADLRDRGTAVAIERYTSAAVSGQLLAAELAAVTEVRQRGACLTWGRPAYVTHSQLVQPVRKFYPPPAHMRSSPPPIAPSLSVRFCRRWQAAKAFGKYDKFTARASAASREVVAGAFERAHSALHCAAGLGLELRKSGLGSGTPPLLPQGRFCTSRALPAALAASMRLPSSPRHHHDGVKLNSIIMFATLWIAFRRSDGGRGWPPAGAGREAARRHAAARPGARVPPQGGAQAGKAPLRRANAGKRGGAHVVCAQAQTGGIEDPVAAARVSR
jgi:hypothetical protein